MIRRQIRTQKALQQAIMKQLEKEAQRMMQSMLKDFSSHLASEAEKMLKTSLGGGGRSDASSSRIGGGQSGWNWENGLGNVAALGINYLFHRTRTQTTLRETSRSQEADAAFRLSQSQSFSEAQRALSKGQKNL